MGIQCATARVRRDIICPRVAARSWNALWHKLHFAMFIGGVAHAEVIGVICVHQLQNSCYFRLLQATEPD